MPNRRNFISFMGVTCLILSVDRVLAQSAMVAETDSQAAALGYKADAHNVDKKKFPRYVDGQKCMGCALYQSAGSKNAGPCSLFPGKQVAAKGWCNAWTKRS